MASIDKAAIIWSVAIVVIGVGFAAVGNNNNDNNNRLASEIGYDDKKTDSVFPGGMSAKQTGDATPTSIFLKTDGQTYSINDKIKISGSVGTKLSDTPISMIVSAPNGDIVTIAQMEVDDDSKSFDTTVPIGGALWKQEGEYTIRINYGKENTQEIIINFVLPKTTSDASGKEQQLETQFADIRNNIEDIGYDVCNIRLEENTIIIDLNWIFEGTEKEKKIISKIPSDADYKIIYHEGYTDYFINTETGHECDYPKCESPLVLINGECAYVTHPFDVNSSNTSNDENK